jgi:tripartite-type tricarboxylate transporter receptor subunit TctC
LGFWFAAYVPATTPATVVNKLHNVLVEATRGQAMQSFYATTGTDPFTTTPAELGKFQLAESDKWKAIIRKAGIEPE